MSTRSARGWLLTMLAVTAGAPAHAHACGGLYCDRPVTVPDAFGNPPPVQAGEQIVYGVESDGSLVMTVRILYGGTAADFAWILPVPAVPEISLGADELFAALDRTTVPTFGVRSSRVEGTCATNPTCRYDGPTYSSFGCGASGTAAAPDAGHSAADVGAAADASTGPRVEQMGTVGPYDTVVLSGGTGDEVVTWLTDNGYAVTAESAPLLDAYASHGSHFVALRLHGDAQVSEIQPVTLTMPSTAPCLPIRLTALATMPDLPITAFFLGDARAVTTNYSMLDPDYEAPGLYATGLHPIESYDAYITRQVDAAGGHAFVTDFAGATPRVPTLALPSVLDLATEPSPSTFLASLDLRGYLDDPRIIALLVHYVVPPSGAVARTFYSCLAFGGPSCAAPTSYDPAGAVAAIDETFTQPLLAADALIARHPYTTRLFTTLSAEEMTLDPEFRLDPDLGDVLAAHTVTLVRTCDASVYSEEAGGYLETPGGLQFGTFAAFPHQTADAWCEAHFGYYYRAETHGCGCVAPGARRPPTWLALGVLAALAGLARRTRGRAARLPDRDRFR